MVVDVCKMHFNLSSPLQTGVQDYETFNDQLDSLGCWVVEAEEALRVQDPSSSTDLTVIQERMDDLKVCFDLYLLFTTLGTYH